MRVLLALLLATAPLAAQFTPSPKLPDERMEALKRMSTPGVEHSRLARRAGSYTTVTRHFAAAGAAGPETTGKAEVRLILGGRFLLEEYRSDRTGGGEGTRLFGYDGTMGRHQAVFATAGATGMVVLDGEAREAGALVVFTGTIHDADKEPLSLRVHLREVDADRFLLVLGGDERGQGPRQETLYTRVKPASTP
jgi:hypothetical protein